MRIWHVAPPVGAATAFRTTRVKAVEALGSDVDASCVAVRVSGYDLAVPAAGCHGTGRPCSSNITAR